MLALYYHMKTKKDKSGILFDEYYKSILENTNLRFKDDLTTKCRICLQECTTTIYGNDYTEKIVDALQSFGNINLNEDYRYPKHLCTVCSNFIKAAMLFRKTAKNTDKLLQQTSKEKDPIVEQSDDNDEYSNCSVNEDTDQIWENREEIKKKEKVIVNYAAKVKCHICNKVLNRKYYEHHKTMHDPDHKKYACDTCGKTFRLKCARYAHSQTHKKDFPYKCQLCPYRGSCKYYIKLHMRTHTGDYSYMCTECPERFMFKSNLNKHMLKHKEPKFKCDKCQKAFYTKLQLQRHFEATHLGIKNHVCGMCGKAFGYRSAMMKHQLRVHKREKLLHGRSPAYLQAECVNQDLR